MSNPSRFLRTSGVHATISPDPWTEGAFVLSIDGAEQSQVNLKHPEEIFYEYLRRIANAVDLLGEPGAPIAALHLGAGALTLARYIEATRPGSVQHAVELERELLDFVVEHLPLPEGSSVETHIGDARDALAEMPAGLKFDAIILVIFSGPEAPAHIACAEFYAEAAALLAPGGVLLVNVGDEPGFTLVSSQIKELRNVMTSVGAYGTTNLFTKRFPGNVILMGTQEPWQAEWSQLLLAKGPHPATVQTGVDLDHLAG